MYKDRCGFFEKVIKLIKLQLQRDHNKNKLFTSGVKRTSLEILQRLLG